MLTHASLFSGIGGFDLAAQCMGWQNILHCEKDEFCQTLLNYYWPNSIIYNDIKTTDFTKHNGTIDILSGGFPCQPFSHAEKRKGTEDDRHLWPQMLRAIREIQPSYIVGENVYGLVNWDGGLVFKQVQADLEDEGYEVAPVILPACGINAPHRRERIFFIAYSASCSERSSRKSNRPFGFGGRINEQQDKWKPEAKQHNGCRNVLWDAANSANAGAESLQQWQNGISAFGIIADTNNRSGQEYRLHAGGKMPKNSVIEEWNVTNTERKQTKRFKFEQRKFSEQEQREFRGTCSEICSECNVAHTRCCERQNGLHGQKQGRETAEFGDSYTQHGQWDQFPTQSPICSRNDGLSDKLDGITFPKWRNESIKAYGNAVVPQLVYIIFKAIQEHYNQNKML